MEKFVLSHISEFCKIKKWDYKKERNLTLVKCPYCKNNSLTAQQILDTHLIKCLSPDCERKNKPFTIISILSHLEPNIKQMSRDNVIQHIKELLNLKNITDIDKNEINKLLEFYRKNNWSLVPIVKNEKRCILSEWNKKEFRDIEEWKKWIYDTGLNIAVRTGIVSNITVIDLDILSINEYQELKQNPNSKVKEKIKDIPEIIKKLIGNTLIQKTNKGYHLFYKYDKDLFKTRIDNLEELYQTHAIDIENDGGLIVLYPSIVSEEGRSFINQNEIIEIPNEFKDFLLKKQPIKLQTNSEKLAEIVNDNNYRKPLVKEGEGRNDFLIHMGGLYRNHLNSSQTEIAISILNDVVCNPPLPRQELRNTIIKSVEKYRKTDENELVNKILQYMRQVNGATHYDVERAIEGHRLEGEKKQRLDKAISYLIRENFIKKINKEYFLVKKMAWDNNLIDDSMTLPFQFPYFYDVGRLCWGDMLLLTASSGTGKTHMALNIIKQLNDKGQRPIYYVYKETGGRHKRIALQLGITENDMKCGYCEQNEIFELEDNAITVYDWLDILDYAKTGEVLGKFTDQLEKHKGLLIIFVQGRNSEESPWYARDQIMRFPSIAASYHYDSDDNTIYGHFVVHKIRERLISKPMINIPCKFDFDTQLLQRVDSLKGKIIINENNNDNGIINLEK